MKKIFLIIGVFFLFMSPFYIFSSLADEAVYYEIGENEALDFNLPLGKMAKVVFKPSNLGAWNISVFHSASFDAELGVVSYAIVVQEDSYNILAQRPLCFINAGMKECVPSPSVDFSKFQETDEYLAILVTNSSGIDLPIEIFLYQIKFFD